MPENRHADTALAQPIVAGWEELVDCLRNLPGLMLAKLPEERQCDPQMQQEIGRLALEALASCAIDAIGGDPDFPAFLPALGQVLNIGQPNADTIYRATHVAADGHYRLRGRKGALNQVKIGQIIAHTTDAGPVETYLDVNGLHADEQGNFDVLISPERPEAHTGDWWQLQAGANKLMVRMVSQDWNCETEPTFSIERVDRPLRRGRTPAAVLEARLRRLAPFVSAMGSMFVDHVEQLRQQGYVHQFKEFDVSQIGGLTGQFYYEAVYELGDDEALILETQVPAICHYRSLILTNEIYETTDWYNAHSSLNGAQSAPDSDGIWRVVISGRDPGVRNWLDTGGYPTGIIQGRWTDCSDQPIPRLRKVTLGEATACLPNDTAMVSPEERNAIMRERRFRLQQRSLW
jgi:hypothetical protein